VQIQEHREPAASFIDSSWRDLLRSLRVGSGSQPVLAEDASGVRTTQNPKRVLIVEDNIDAARTAAFLISDMGHSAEYAINGYAALSAAKKFKPHVVLLDLGLPGLDGFEVCRRVKADPELDGVRVIVITGYAGVEYREHALAAGCDEHFVKPMPAKVLEDLLG
jgi:CheY-like chemotaxis protein